MRHPGRAEDCSQANNEVAAVHCLCLRLAGWLRGLDLNQRPLGYEPFRNRDSSQRATNNTS